MIAIDQPTSSRKRRRRRNKAPDAHASRDVVGAQALAAEFAVRRLEHERKALGRQHSARLAAIDEWFQRALTPTPSWLWRVTGVCALAFFIGLMAHSFWLAGCSLLVLLTAAAAIYSIERAAYELQEKRDAKRKKAEQRYAARESEIRRVLERKRTTANR